MKENQQLEWKETWRDEFLRSVCGFANAEGGELHIGRNDQGIQRIERYPVPDPALREAVLDALVHRDYAIGAPVQIRVYEDRLRIWNPCVLPDGWTVKTLFG